MANTSLLAPLHSLKGVGKRLAEKLQRLQLHQVNDLLFHFPLRYQDKTRIHAVAAIRPGEEAQFLVEVLHCEVVLGRKSMLLVYTRDHSASLCLRFFSFSAAFKKQFHKGQKLLVFGVLQQGKQGAELLHPEFTLLQSAAVQLDKGATPVYPLTEGISQARMRSLVKQALQLAQQSRFDEILPEELCAKWQLPEFGRAIADMHYPPVAHLQQGQLREGAPFRLRLVIEEILAHQLKQQQQKKQLFNKPAHIISPDRQIMQNFYRRLPFELTGAQKKVIAEIEQDMQQATPMIRLLQGDVGSGKTLVAAAAALNVIANGFQVALLAPTEILAEQHYQSFLQWFAPFQLELALLKGKMKNSHKQSLMQKLADAEIHLVAGTHALIQETVRFAKLGLVIIDEQHRFGVLQRKALVEKGQHLGKTAHQLMMTATPIPRTLAMTAYADLQVSVIDQLPKGRKPVITFVMEQSRREQILQKIRQHCQSGQQLYWVCTLIEESEFLQNQTAEQTLQLLQQALPELEIALIHGKLKSEQKDAIMQGFKQGKIHILVSTTVIEVGVNVPNATLMIIEDADRLGLAQLHQLRGRVGRGEQQSYCALLYKAPLSDNGRQRLGIMRQSNNGFEIAEKDLQLRGPGEYIGTRQTGQLRFKVVRLEQDQLWIERCHQLAATLNLEADKLHTLLNRWINPDNGLINI